MKKFLLLSFMLMFAFAFSESWAQERTVSGKVTSVEDGSTLPGVNVVLKGTTTGTVTDIDGNYKLSVPSDGGTLVFSFIGLASEEVQIGSRSVIDVSMSPDVQQLSEVVISGYRPVTKERSNISASTVDATAIEARPNPSITQRLQGEVAGLAISTGSGQPGANSTIQLRGVNSINGETEPLFIIDGTPVDGDNFRSLNPNEIANVTVLKDAGATAIYGNRGANGVILVETKRGGYDRPLQITYSFQRNYNELQDNDYNLMNSQEQLRLERAYNQGRGVGLSDAEINDIATTDWVDEFFDIGVADIHNLQISGGGENTNAYFSFGYTDNEGILQQSNLERFNLRSNINGKTSNNKFNYGANISLNYSRNEEPNNIATGAINRNYILGAYQSVTYLSPDDYTNGAALLDEPDLFLSTPLLLLDRLNTFDRNENEVKFVGSVNANYEIIEGLSVGIRAGLDYQREDEIESEGPSSFNALFFAEDGNTTPGYQQHQSTQETRYNQVVNLNYDRSFGEHNFNLGLYNEYYKAHLYAFGFFNEGLNPQTYDHGDGSAFVDDNAENDFFVDAVNANQIELGLLSFFGQIDYDYASKYGFVGTVRRDASSRFAEDFRWGTFWSVAGRWNIHQEAFAESLPFEVLKLRASYGTNGNEDISGSDNFIFNDVDNFRALFSNRPGYGGANSTGLAQVPIDNIRWETVSQANVGIDAEVFNGRLRTTVEAYLKRTTDLFIPAPVSAVNSITSIDQNIGELENRGFDLSLQYDVIRTNDMNLTLKFVGNYNKNELISLPSENGEIIGTGREGGPLFEYFEFRYAGVNSANGNLLFLTADGELTENPNPDTDRVWLNQNLFPDYQGSFGFDFNYKGLFVNANMTYTVGVDRFDFVYAGFMDPTNIGTFRHSNDLTRAWTEGNTNTDIPSLTASNIDLDGNRWITDASFARLRFLTVGYDFPSSLLEKIGLRSARVFVNGENLFTLTEWRGFDAEQPSNTGRRYPTPRTYSFGFEIGL